MKKNNILVPDLPESVSDATVAKWYKKVGDIIDCDEVLLDLETDKIMLEISSPCQGQLDHILEQEGSIVKSQQILGTITKYNNIKIQEHNNTINIDHQKNVNKPNFNNLLSLSPSMRRLTKIHNVDSNLIKNFHYNTIRQDIINQVKKAEINNNSNPFLYTQHKNNTLKEKKEICQKRVPMTRLRQKIAERLLETKKNTAMLTTFNEVNMKPIMLIRQKYGDIFKKKYNVRIGLMSFYVKAVVEGLKKFPNINASIDNTDIIYYNNFDISIAVSTPRGLITPVLKNADNMSMFEIERKIQEFSIKGYENKISMEELIGGNFTITNGGVFGSLMSTPIINPPQTAILGMHAIKERPMVVDKKIVILPMMYLALSYDHCLIDGKDAISFLMFIKNILEDFNRILIDI